VTLTGSVGAGRSVASAAAGEVKKTVPELGGSDPYIGLRDADIDATVQTCGAARLNNSGQSCIAAQRFISEAPLLDEPVDAFVDAMKAKRAAHPLDPNADLGPLAQRKTRDRLHEQIQRSVSAGARCVLGGEMPSSAGYFYPPTVLTGVEPGMPAF